MNKAQIIAIQQRLGLPNRMNIQLGNLSVADMEKRSGVIFPDGLKQLLATSHQENATHIKPGQWHCFDVPFMLVCGDMAMAQKVWDFLKGMSSSFIEPLQIGIR